MVEKWQRRLRRDELRAISLVEAWAHASEVRALVLFLVVPFLLFCARAQVAAVLWRVSFKRDSLPAVQMLINQFCVKLFEFENTFSQSRKFHVVRAPPRAHSPFGRGSPLMLCLATSQMLHVVEQLERLGTPRGLAVEAMEATNKFTRAKKLTRTNQQNVCTTHQLLAASH